MTQEGVSGLGGGSNSSSVSVPATGWGISVGVSFAVEIEAYCCGGASSPFVLDKGTVLLAIDSGSDVYAIPK